MKNRDAGQIPISYDELSTPPTSSSTHVHIAGEISGHVETNIGCTTYKNMSIDDIEALLARRATKTQADTPLEPSEPFDITKPWGQYPFPVKHYVERPELIRIIHEKLHQPGRRGRAALSAYHGLGGIGKTQLAAHYFYLASQADSLFKEEHYQTAYQALFKDCHYKGLFWFRASTYESLLQDYYQLGLALSLFDTKTKQEEALPIVTRWLERAANAGWLAVYDDAYADYNAGDRVFSLQSLLPKQGGHILITSRNQAVVDEDDRIGIPLMTDEKDIIALMTPCLGPAIPKPKAALLALAKTMGYLPLAMRQACGYINQTTGLNDIYQYLLCYEEEAKRYLEKNTLPVGDEHKPVYVTFQMSLKAIAQRCPEAMGLLWGWGLVHPTLPLPWTLGARILSINPQDKPQEILTVLESYSLVSSSKTSHYTLSHIMIHQLLHVTLKEELPQELTEPLQLQWAYALLEESEEQNPSMQECRRRINLTQHLETFIREYDTAHATPEEMTHLIYAELLTILADIHDDAGHPEEKRVLLEKALSIKKAHYGENHFEVAITLTNLANAYGALGNPQQKKSLLEKALSIKKAHYGENHFEVAITLTNLANAYGDLGNPQQQKSLLEKALSIDKAHYGENHFEVAITLTNLANAYGDLGNPQQKKSLLEKALSIKKAHYGENHFEVAKTLGNLANAYGALGNPQQQKSLLEKALSIQKDHYGENHFEVAITLTNLANAYGALGNPQQQKSLLKKALSIQKAHYGENHFEVAKTLGNLATAYGALGNPQQQKSLLEKALSIQKDHYGENHFEVAITLTNLANAYGDLGNPQQQKSLLEKALSIEKAHYGENHFEVAITLFNLANAYGDLGNPQQQKSLLEKALSIEKAHYGENHFEVAMTLNNLANAYGDLGNPQQQKSLLEKALSIQKDHYGENHFEVAKTLGNLANAYGDLGNPQQQKSLLEKALSIEKAHYGENHFEVAMTLNNLANAYGDLGNPQQQKSLLEKALSIQKDHYGENHFEVAKTLFNLAIAEGDLDNQVQKRAHLETVLPIFKTHYGPQHPYVVITLGNLAKSYRVSSCEKLQQGHPLQALPLAKQAYQTYRECPGYDDSHPDVQTIVELIQGIQILLSDLMTASLSQEEPHDAPTHTAAGYYYLSQAELDKAIHHYEQAIALDDSYPEPYHNLACCYHIKAHTTPQQAAHCLQQAEYYFNQALKLKPTPGLHTEYGQFLYLQKRPDKALPLLTQAIAMTQEVTEMNLSYDLLELPTLDTTLQTWVQNHETLRINSAHLAYYLIYCCYEALELTQQQTAWLTQWSQWLTSLPGEHPVSHYLLTTCQNEHAATAIHPSVHSDTTETNDESPIHPKTQSPESQHPTTAAPLTTSQPSLQITTETSSAETVIHKHWQHIMATSLRHPVNSLNTNLLTSIPLPSPAPIKPPHETTSDNEESTTKNADTPSSSP